jgi:hypothetical protein
VIRLRTRPSISFAVRPAEAGSTVATSHKSSSTRAPAAPGRRSAAVTPRAERDAVKAAGVSWWAYQSFMKKHEKQIEEEKLVRVPGTLDLTPYRDEKDFGLLERLVRKKKSK